MISYILKRDLKTLKSVRVVFLFVFPKAIHSTFDYHATYIALDLFVSRAILYFKSYLWDL
jgi:hypothetical protein